MKSLTAACLILTVLMGPMGMQALSDISGLTIVAGHYEFLADGVIIHAVGRADGVIWQITAIWPTGGNLTIIQHSPRREI